MLKTISIIFGVVHFSLGHSNFEGKEIVALMIISHFVSEWIGKHNFSRENDFILWDYFSKI